MIRHVVGDATAPIGDGNKIIAHVCNDIGRWGKGFVLAVSKRWQEPEQRYRKWFAEQSCDQQDENGFALGAVQFVPVLHGKGKLYVANMIAQHGISFNATNLTPIRYDALRYCLLKVALKAAELGATVHMPRIGCGLAGGEWCEVEAILNDVFSEIDVTVYDYEACTSTAT